MVILQFDNVHSERDNPNVPSDLEQMPALRNFITSNGTLLTNDHTILISHTAKGIVSTETGLYPDRNGVTVGNSYQYFDPNAPTNGNVGGSDFTSAFKYWTDPVAHQRHETTRSTTTRAATAATRTRRLRGWRSPARAATSPASARPTWSSRTRGATWPACSPASTSGR